MLNRNTTFKKQTHKQSIISPIYNFRFYFPIRSCDWKKEPIWIYRTISAKVSYLKFKININGRKIVATITFLSGQLYFGWIQDINEDQAEPAFEIMLQNFVVLNSAKCEHVSRASLEAHLSTIQVL